MLKEIQCFTPHALMMILEKPLFNQWWIRCMIPDGYVRMLVLMTDQPPVIN